MEMPRDREAALYTMLKQVLENYIVTQRLSYHQTLAAWTAVLGFQLGMMIDTRDEVLPLLEHTVAALHAQQRSRTQPPLPSFADYGEAHDWTPSHDLGNALVTLLNESSVEYQLSVAATWRVVVALCADVLAMPRLDEAAQPWDIDRYIDDLREQLPAQIDYWLERLGGS
jgi:hypothetical protein